MADTIGDLLVRIGFDPRGLDEGASAIETRLERTGTRLFFLGSRIAAGFSAPLGVAVGMIAKVGLEFDQAMTQSLAIMERVTPQMRSSMEATAKDIATKTKFGATEAAEAYYHLASAGLDAAQAQQALPVVATFAQAGMMKMEKAAESLAAVQAGLGLKTADATQNMVNMNRVTDVLVELNNRALGTVENHTTALVRSAGSVRLYGKSLEEGAAVLGVYAEKGILGANAGQQLFMIMRDLTSAAVRKKDAFAAAGIAVFDSQGKMRNMADIANDLTKRLGGMSDEGRRAELMTLGLTSRSQNALLPLIGMGEKIRDLQKALEGAGGASQRVADEQMKSLEHQLKLIKNEFVNLGIELFTAYVPIIKNDVLPLMRDMVGMAKGLAEWLSGLSDEQKKWVLGVAAAGIALGPVISVMGSWMLVIRALFAPFASLIGWIAGTTSVVQTANGAVLAKTAIWGGLAARFPMVATAVGLVRTAFLGLTASIWPVAAAVGAVYGTYKLLDWAGWHDWLGKHIAKWYGVSEAQYEATKKAREYAKEQKNINKEVTDFYNLPRTEMFPGGIPPFDPGGGGSGNGGNTPNPVTTKAQNIIDRVLGVDAKESAEAWTIALKKVGGAVKLARDDIKTAMDVYADAIDRTLKMEGANSKLAESYSKIWFELHRLSGLPIAPGVNFGPVNIPGGLPPGIPGGMGIPTNDTGIGVFTGLPGGWSRGDVEKLHKEIIDAASGMAEWKKAVQGMGTTGTELQRLSKLLDGSIKELVEGLAGFLITASAAGNAGIRLDESIGEITKSKNLGELTAGITKFGTGVIEAFAAFQTATSGKSILGNALGGGMVGSQIGQAFGGVIGSVIGGAVGAIAGALKGKPEWAKFQSDVARDFGVTISDELAKKLEEDSKKFGRAATANIHLSEIIGEAGGLNSGNLEKFTGKLRETFSMLEMGWLDAAQATKVLDDNFAQFVEAGTDGYGRLNPQLKEIVRLTQEFGLESKAVGDYLKGQGKDALAGFGAVATEILRPYNDWIDRMDAAKEKGDNLSKLLTEQKTLAAGAKQTLDDLGIQAVASFGAAVAAGVPWLEALRAAAPSVSQLMDVYRRLGIEVDNVALKVLGMQAQLLEKNPELMAAIAGLASQMVALDNMGQLNVETFGAMQRTGLELFRRLEAEAIAMGGTSVDALFAMQDWLHQCADAAAALGVPLDENVQHLIDMSRENGIWQEQALSTNEVMMMGFAALIDALGGEIPEAFRQVVDKIEERMNDIHVDPIDVPVNWDIPPFPELPPMARGGIVTGPTPVLAGEAGAEAIIPLSQLNRIMGGGSGTMTVIMEVDGDELARKTLQYMPGELRRHGLFT